MADYMIWPWVERFEMVRIVAEDQFRISDDKFQRLVNYPPVKYLMYLNII